MYYSVLSKFKKEISWNDIVESKMDHETYIINKYCLLLSLFRCLYPIEDLKKYFGGTGNFENYISFIDDIRKKRNDNFSNDCLLNNENFKKYLNTDYKFDENTKYDRVLLQTYHQYVNRPEVIPCILISLVLGFTIFCTVITFGVSAVNLCYSIVNYFTSMANNYYNKSTYISIFAFMFFFLSSVVLQHYLARYRVLEGKDKEDKDVFNYGIDKISCLKTLASLKVELKQIINNQKEVKEDKSVNEKVIDYSKLSNQELVSIFKSSYNDQIIDYPDFLEILRTKKFGDHIILNEDYSFAVKADRRMVLYTISKKSSDKNKGKDNDIELLRALFKLDVKNGSDLVTQKPPIKIKIPKFIKFLTENTIDKK